MISIVKSNLNKKNKNDFFGVFLALFPLPPNRKPHSSSSLSLSFSLLFLFLSLSRFTTGG